MYLLHLVRFPNTFSSVFIHSTIYDEVFSECLCIAHIPETTSNENSSFYCFIAHKLIMRYTYIYAIICVHMTFSQLRRTDPKKKSPEYAWSLSISSLLWSVNFNWIVAPNSVQKLKWTLTSISIRYGVTEFLF